MGYRDYALNDLKPNIYKKESYQSQEEEQAYDLMKSIQNYDMRYTVGGSGHASMYHEDPEKRGRAVFEQQEICDRRARAYEEQFVRLAESGYAPGWYFAAWCYEERPKLFGMVQESAAVIHEKVQSYYQKAIDAGMEEAKVSLAIYDIFGDYREKGVGQWKLAEGLRLLMECAKDGNPDAMYALSKILVNDIYQYGYKEWLIDLSTLENVELAIYWGMKACAECEKSEHVSKLVSNGIEILIGMEEYGAAKYFYAWYRKTYGYLSLAFLEDEDAARLIAAEAEGIDLKEFADFIEKELAEDFQEMNEKILKKAEEHQKSASELALDYFFGDGVEQDYEKAFHYLTIGAKEDAFSMAMLGHCYYYGKGCEENDRLSVYWSQKAVEHGEKWGYEVLGNHYYYGIYLAQCPAYARYCFENCGISEEYDWKLQLDTSDELYAERNEKIQSIRPVKPPYIVFDDAAEDFFTAEDPKELHHEAMKLLGYPKGDGRIEKLLSAFRKPKIDIPEAERLLTLAADMGYFPAIESIGYRYLDVGQGTEPVYEDGRVVGFAADTEKALKYIDLAARQGDYTAIEGIAELYSYGDRGIEKDDEKAREYWTLLYELYQEEEIREKYLEGFEENVRTAASDIAMEEGRKKYEELGRDALLDGDVENAKEYFKKAVFYQSGEGAFWMSSIYQAEDQPEEAEKYSEAVEYLDWDGLEKTENFWEIKTGRIRERRQKEKFHDVAAKVEKEPLDMAYLAMAYRDGEVCEINLRLSIYWAQKAIEQGEALGYAVLGEHYCSGLYLAKCPAYARYCYEQYAEAADCEWEILPDEKYRKELSAIRPVKPNPIIFDDTAEDFFEAEDAVKLYFKGQKKLGYVGPKEEKPVILEINEGEEILDAAAQMGHCRSMVTLARYYLDNGQEDRILYDEEDRVINLEADNEKALTYWDMAARQGDEDALKAIAAMYTKGAYGIVKDKEKAREYWELCYELYQEEIVKGILKDLDKYYGCS